MRFIGTYLCLKTISFAHIFKFWKDLDLTCSFESSTYQELAQDAQMIKTTRSLEEIYSPTSGTNVAMSSPLNSARDIWISRIKHFIQLRIWWGSFQTWSRHINSLSIEMCRVSHYLLCQITIFHEKRFTPGSPGSRSRVTRQQTEAYQVTRAQGPDHLPTWLTGLAPVRPVPVTGQTGDPSWSILWWLCPSCPLIVWTHH
jgi:hypothetical protein